MLPLRTIYLDTSHLHKLVTDFWCSTDKTRRSKAHNFLDKLNSEGFVIFLSHHILHELFAHRSDDIVLERINFLANLPVLSSAPDTSNSGVIGHWMDVLKFEIKFQLNKPHADYETICDSIKSQVVTFSSGSDLIKNTFETYSYLRDSGLFDTQSAAEHESLLHSNDGRSFDNLKITKFNNYQFKSDKEIVNYKSHFVENTKMNLVKHGDKKLKNIDLVASDFAAHVLGNVESLKYTTAKPDLETYLEAQGVNLNQITKNTKFRDVKNIGTFNSTMKDFIKEGILTAEEVSVIDREKLPSWLIITEIEDFMRSEPRATGSSLMDRYHMPYISYVDAMSCDKRVMQYINISKHKHSVFQRARDRCKAQSCYSNLV